MKNSVLLFRSILIIALLTGIAHLFSSKSTFNPDSNTGFDFLDREWKNEYYSESTQANLVYRFYREHNVYKAYLIRIENQKGTTYINSTKESITIHNFDGKKGSGIYNFEYQGENHISPCEIIIQNKDSFKLCYEYYGQSECEIWKKQ